MTRVKGRRIGKGPNLQRGNRKYGEEKDATRARARARAIAIAKLAAAWDNEMFVVQICAKNLKSW